MKKSLAFLTVLAVLLFGVAGALAVIPHGHGDDFDHSKHASCPVYQAGLHAPAFALFSAVFAFFLITAARHVSSEPRFFFFTHLTYTSLRAPPITA